MSVRASTAAALLTGASLLAIGAATPAAALCDAYSGGCPSPPPSGVGGGGTGIGGGDDSPATGNDAPTTGNPGTDGGTGSGAGGGAGTDVGGTSGGPAGTGGGAGTTTSPSTSPSTLPFTGGELVLMSAVGLGVLAGGTALVVAGRRRAGTTA